MKLAIIAAMTPERVIGKSGRLPWTLSEDLRRFKALTSGHPLIMGRKTWESLPKKPLPGRRNIVLSRTPGYEAPGAEVFSTLKQAVGELAPENVLAFVIGGAALFKEALPVAERLYLTLIHHPFEGDVLFPEYALSDWKIISRVRASSLGKPAFDYEFIDALRS
jgi:dihydrofolate reductase